MATVTAVDGRECRLLIGELAPVYPEAAWVQYLLFALGQRPAVAMTHGGERAAVVDWLDQRSPYMAFAIPRLNATIFARSLTQIEHAKTLEERADAMDDPSYHRTAGRALAYPPECIEYFVEHADSRLPNAVESAILCNDMLREGELSFREWELLDLLPYILPPTREVIRREVETARQWALALPAQLGYGHRGPSE